MPVDTCITCLGQQDVLFEELVHDPGDRTLPSVPKVSRRQSDVSPAVRIGVVVGPDVLQGRVAVSVVFLL